jgi:hypothetical protein
MRPPPAKGIINKITQANMGHVQAHHGVCAVATLMIAPGDRPFAPARA